MGLKFEAENPGGNLPRSIVLTISCDFFDCQRVQEVITNDFVSGRRQFTRDGWIERADGSFNCPRCSGSALAREGRTFPMSDFAWAIGALKNGEKVSRSGWNGVGMWIHLELPHPDVFDQTKVLDIMPAQAGLVDKEVKRMTLPYIYMSTVQGDLVPWLASQTDLLAEDWTWAS